MMVLRMQRVKKILLVVLFLVLLSQIPFAYRRYRLGRLNASIQMINSASRQLESVRAEKRSPFPQRYENYTGVLHVHSFLGGHSEGTFQEIISGALANNLQFVIMTEHVENQFDTSAMTLKGSHGSVVFVNGNEVMSKEGDRLLSIPGDISLTGSDKFTTADIAANSRARSALSIIAYPDEFKSWTERTDGLEVYNVFTNAKRINPIVALFDSLWSRWKYPDLLFANYLERPGQSLKKWDELLAQGKVSAFAGNDSHSNIGFSFDYGSGQKLIDLKLDPYETSFRLVRLHVLVQAGYEHSTPIRQSLDETNLLDALRTGHFFIGFDLLGDTSNFRFEARNSETSKIQGDEIVIQGETRLNVTLPSVARMIIYRDGNVVLDESGISEKELAVTERGVYRVEVYLPQLGKPFSEQPWIISNPIYVR
jgi:hypothetical protein